jgi:hypothetical protein
MQEDNWCSASGFVVVHAVGPSVNEAAGCLRGDPGLDGHSASPNRLSSRDGFPVDLTEVRPEGSDARRRPSMTRFPRALTRLISNYLHWAISKTFIGR